jgi:hypothetical protein
MQSRKKADEAAKAAFLKKVAALWPIARGTVSLVRKPCSRKVCRACASGERHPALIYTCRVGGRGRCLHVRKADEALVRMATENCRKLEALLAEEGVRLIGSLREADAD